MNNIVIMGRLCADPEIRTSTSGKTVCSLMVAVDRKNKEKETDFFPCVAFDKTADNIERFFSKGNRILLRGSMQSRKFEKDGKPQINWKMVVNEFDFVESRDAAKEPAAKEPAPASYTNAKAEDFSNVVADDDDFPF